jgi:hypothetical protein
MKKFAGCLALAAFLCLAGEAFGAVRCESAIDCLPPVAMPEPSFPLEFGVTAVGFAGLLYWFKKRIIRPAENR